MPDTGRLLIAGDVGGTKSLLGAYTAGRSAPTLVADRRFENSGYASIEEILSEFIDESKLKDISSLCLAVACPVEDNCGTLTNLRWRIDAEAIAKRFNIAAVSIVNDLVATGAGSLLLTDADLHTLQKGITRQGNRALIAAGTGLGEAMLFWDGKTHLPSASEGGHTDFAPRTPLETELLDYLTRHYGHVSYERCLSGPGLEAVYLFLKSRNMDDGARLEASKITELAFEGEDATCSEALNLFISIYGAEAGNLALKTMSTGGIYIGGGIGPKILKALEGDTFIKAFRAKGRFEEWLSRIPIHVILNQKAALLGAASYAQRNTRSA
ncbi:MAG: glucokinase [Deltaproteobacteria bacterium RIFCSPLOWO2_02_FULL_53_8]|nr:MAG: glucokinase [Deltaproteobacteria bacterium RIFCSPLOWO2_02_FULL_53_8]